MSQPTPAAEPDPQAATRVAHRGPVAEPEPETAPRDASQDTGDIEGARLIALNMALNGQSREETDRYLAENFDLRDRESLLDEVYATVEG